MNHTAAIALLTLLTACTDHSQPAPSRALSANSHCDPARQATALHASGSPASAPALIPCRYGTGIRAMEPSFGFAKDGRILYQGWALRDETPGGVTPYPLVVRSADGGLTWQDVSPLGPI